ncbi:hypothetical protein [Tsukamurella pseudospumae]|uniref:hypothetical protein n=1 Tax=Tsukamurella pseudospumae TaxID=239498 RepID=UPI001C3032C3|nr:hypothetical protein [Tsukamurella pseudospumae]
MAEPIRRWLAERVADQFSTRSTVKRLSTARGLVHTAKRFAVVIAEHPTPARTPQDVGPEHVLAYRERYQHLKPRTVATYVESLRQLLDGDEQLTTHTRDTLAAVRVRQGSHRNVSKTGYTDDQWQQILTAARHDIRLARTRIENAQQLVARYRSGQVPAGSDDAALGSLLDGFDRTGQLPRTKSGYATPVVNRFGGLIKVSSMLCLSPGELVAFAVLLIALTGQNFGTIAAWPAAHFRPDGGLTDRGVALVEASKPRRGPEREHMIIALEDILTSDDPERRWLRSPLRVYQLLLSLGETARRLSGSDNLFAGRIAKQIVHTPTPWITTLVSLHVQRWAAAHGFPTATTTTAARGKPVVAVRTLRLTAIERRRRPMAHTTATMNDTYLMPQRSVQVEGQAVVAAALNSEVDKAHKHARVPVFTRHFVDLAHHDPHAAATHAGMDVPVLTGLLDGSHDTILLSCRDNEDSPHSPPGSPCPVSFLTCLDCTNARALPHQLPVQLAAADALVQLRPHLQPELWAARYAPRLQQLHEITASFSRAEIDHARTAITAEHRQRVNDLLEGQWDLQ